MTTEDEKLGIELWAIEDLKPYDKNVKKHPKDQVQKLANSIRKFGWTQPIVVDVDGVIIAGHGRRLAAISLGLKRVPVVVRRDLNKTEADALRLADNRVASTEYDMELVKDALRDLANANMDLLEFTGFEQKDIDIFTQPLEMMDDAVFVDDIQEAVESQKSENSRKAEEIDESAAPLVDAFGFKRVTVAQSRKIRIFMNEIEKETGKKGAEALFAYITELGY